MTKQANVYRIVRYPDLVQSGAGRTEPGVYDTRREAQRALRAAYPGRTLSEIWAYAQARVEKAS